MKNLKLWPYSGTTLVAIFTVFFLSAEIGAANKPPAKRKPAKYEEPTVMPVDELLPAEIIKGKYYTISPNVPTDGYENRYFLTSQFGSFRAYGDGMLATRIDEINAIAAMKEVEKSSQFADALKKAAVSPIEGAAMLITNPVDTISGIPAGTWRYLTRVGEMVSGRRGQMEESVGKELIGVGSVKRKIAYQYDVDVYSSNLTLQENLNSLAWASYAGGMTVTIGTLAIGAGSTAALLGVRSASLTKTLNKVLLDDSPEDLRRSNRKALSAMGVDPKLIEAFVNHPWYSPRHKTAIVLALQQMKDAKNRDKFLQLALRAQSEEDAFFTQRIAQLMAAYNDAVSPIREIDTISGLAVAYPANRALLVPIVLDYGWWTAEMDYFSRTLAKAAQQPGLKTKQLWLTGTLSPLARAQLEASGWQIQERALSKLNASEQKAAVRSGGSPA
jgi:hypothetical protein